MLSVPLTLYEEAFFIGGGGGGGVMSDWLISLGCIIYQIKSMHILR